MPTYVYKCENKPDDETHRYEESRAITAEEPENLICKIEGCDGRLLKVFFAPPIKFGDGFGGSVFRQKVKYA